MGNTFKQKIDNIQISDNGLAQIETFIKQNGYKFISLLRKTQCDYTLVAFSQGLKSQLIIKIIEYFNLQKQVQTQKDFNEKLNFLQNLNNQRYILKIIDKIYAQKNHAAIVFQFYNSQTSVLVSRIYQLIDDIQNDICNKIILDNHIKTSYYKKGDIYSIGLILLEALLSQKLTLTQRRPLKEKNLMTGLPFLQNSEHLQFITDILSKMLHPNNKTRIEPADLIKHLEKCNINQETLKFFKFQKEIITLSIVKNIDKIFLKTQDCCYQLYLDFRYQFPIMVRVSSKKY
ncbi:hypothetical protein ABPG72_013873 [Tetrahymena utriculariae]